MAAGSSLQMSNIQRVKTYQVSTRSGPIYDRNTNVKVGAGGTAGQGRFVMPHGIGAPLTTLMARE